MAASVIALVAVTALTSVRATPEWSAIADRRSGNDSTGGTSGSSSRPVHSGPRSAAVRATPRNGIATGRRPTDPRAVTAGGGAAETPRRFARHGRETARPNLAPSPGVL